MSEIIRVIKDMTPKERWVAVAELICLLFLIVVLWAGAWIGCALIDSCYYNYMGVS